MVDVWLKSRYPVFERNLDYNLAMLEQVLLRCRQRGVHAVLVELPLNRDIVGTRFQKAVVQYKVPAMALADEYDVAVPGRERGRGGAQRDFHDLSHLVEPGRVLWQRELAEEPSSPLLKARTAAGGRSRRLRRGVARPAAVVAAR